MAATILRTAATGAAGLNETFVVPVGATYRVISATLHLSAAGTTAENFLITLDSVAGAAYDTVLYTLDLSAGSTVNLLWQPDVELYLIGGDALDVTWTNTETRTWGLLLTMEAIG